MNNTPNFPFADSREERIKTIIDSIRKNDKSKVKSENPKSKTTCVTHIKTRIKSQSVASKVTIRVGWLHREPDMKYKQVRMCGAGIRIVTFEGEDIDAITPQAILRNASRMFFPAGNSTKGALSDMDVSLGTYSRDVIDAFTTLDGEPCSYLKYLKEFGLFSSRVTFYIMTETKLLDGSETGKDIKKSKTDDSDEDSDELSDHADADNQDSCQRGLFNQISSLKIVEEPKLKVVTNASYVIGELSLEYEEITESSYSEVIIRSTSTNILQCYELQSMSEPDIQETPIKEYCPLEMGPFHLTRVRKGSLQFLDLVSMPSQENPEVEELHYTFPQTNGHEEGLILHPPSQMCGYDNGRLIVAVVAACHGNPNANYIWYKDGEMYRQGNSLPSICIDQPGTYSVEVQCGELKEVADSFKVEPVVPPSSIVIPATACILSSEGSISQPKMLPVIDSKELTLGKEIGSGSYGTVFKANWAGTPVAVKVLKVRNAKRVSSTLENEVRVHSSVRHPNIVQMMGVSILKNSVYIVSELIDGKNLDDILFGDDNDESYNLDSDAKLTICRQLCQAIAYMHNLKPQVIHRDIKPANVIVAKSHVTKLCDMGLSKFKSTQSLTTTTAVSMPGTPQYMAPECLLSRKSATAASDIWSLGCTLVECLNGEDLWSEEMEEQHAEDDQITALTTILTAAEPPKSLGNLEGIIPYAFQQVLVKCFEYVTSGRPTARDVLRVFEA